MVALRFPPQASCIYGRPNHGNRLPQPRRHCRDWLSRTPWRCRCFSTSRLGLGTPTHGLSETAFPHGKHESTWPRRRSINIRQAAALSRRGPVYYPDPSPIHNLASPAASRLPQIYFIAVGKGKARRLAPPASVAAFHLIKTSCNSAVGLVRACLADLDPHGSTSRAG